MENPTRVPLVATLMSEVRVRILLLLLLLLLLPGLKALGDSLALALRLRRGDGVRRGGAL